MNYRREVDGLRAVAVLPVILFHAGLSSFSGGFVGVDVFFVISGYLITTIVFGELEEGKFSLARFYERRARRILPALFVVTVATAVAAWFILLPEDLKELGKSLLAVALFSSNFLFWNESGYFDTSAEYLPLLHTWSLAVEEQYYMLFPLLAAALFRRGRQAVVVGLATVALGSFALAQWGATAHPNAAFYLLPFRAWELMVGALAAVYLSRSGLPLLRADSLSGFLAGAGLVMIGLSVHLYDRATPFPGIYALLPAIGAVLIILFARPNNLVGRLLGTKALVYIGLLSYSAYLWHQPLFALARRASLEEPHMRVFLALSVATFVLAYFTRHLVEQPFRSPSKVSRRSIFIGSGATAAVVVGLAFVLYGNKGFPDRIDNYAKVADTFRWQDLAKPCGSEPSLPTGVQALCRLPDPDKVTRVDVALFGDSHADAFLPAVVAATNQRDSTPAYMGLGGCIPLIGVDVRAGNWPAGVCQTLAQEQYNFAVKTRPQNVLLVGRWSMYIDTEDSASSARKYYLVEDKSNPLSKEHSREVFVRGLERTVRAYEALGAKVFFVEQVPQQLADPRAVFHRINQRGMWGLPEAEAAIERNSVSQEVMSKQQALLRRLLDQVPEIEGFTVLRPESHFCTGGKCLMGDKDGPFYHDKDHLNIRGAEHVGPWLVTRMSEANGPR